MKEKTMKNDGNSAKLMVGLIAGFTVGMAVGFAVAPRPGAETREKLLTKVKWQFWSPQERYRYLWKRTRDAQTC